jgi:hypothetical protein
VRQDHGCPLGGEGADPGLEDLHILWGDGVDHVE